jgi:hypothetical protein
MAISGHTASGRPHSPAGAPDGVADGFVLPGHGRLQDVLNGDPKEGVQPEMFIPYTPTLRIGPDTKAAGLSQTWRDSRHLSPRVNEVDKLGATSVAASCFVTLW